MILWEVICRNQNCNCVFEHKQALCCNVGNWNAWYLSPDLCCMWSDKEKHVMFMSRFRISSSVKNWALLQMLFVPGGQCVLEGRKESTGALSFFCSFSILMPFDLQIFASEWVDFMVNRWMSLTENFMCGQSHMGGSSNRNWTSLGNVASPPTGMKDSHSQATKPNPEH